MPLIDSVTMSAAGQPILIKPSLPIELLPTDLARLFTLAHPAILLAAYTIRFPSLVSDPVPTLLSSLLPLAIIQASYAVICLPATGTTVKLIKKPKPGAKKTESPSWSPVVSMSKSSEHTSTDKTKQTIFYALLLSLFSVAVLAAIQVLFGAPVTTHIPHTILSSSHLALLAVFPLVYVHGSDSKKWKEVISAYSPIDEVFGATVGCFLGAWLGAIPIPLDWDREWQKWPVTIVTGAYAGYVVGKLVGGFLLKGKRIELD